MPSPSQSLFAAWVMEERLSMCWWREWQMCFSLGHIWFASNLSKWQDLSSLQKHSLWPWDFPWESPTFQTKGGSWRPLSYSFHPIKTEVEALIGELTCPHTQLFFCSNFWNKSQIFFFFYPSIFCRPEGKFSCISLQHYAWNVFKRH